MITKLVSPHATVQSAALITLAVFAVAALLPVVGFSQISAVVAGVSLVGALATVILLPEPKGISLEELTESGLAGRAPAPRAAEPQRIRAPRA